MKIPGVLTMQNVLNGILMAVGVMEKTLYSSCTHARSSSASLCWRLDMKVLVLYYSSWGHVETMAGTSADGARETGAEVTVKRVPEKIAVQSDYKLDQTAPVATVNELTD